MRKLLSVSKIKLFAACRNWKLRQLDVLRLGRRPDHLPAVRHRQSRGRHLAEGQQEVQQDEEVHGEAGEMQLRGGAR